MGTEASEEPIKIGRKGRGGRRFGTFSKGRRFKKIWQISTERRFGRFLRMRKDFRKFCTFYKKKENYFFRKEGGAIIY